MKEKARQGRLAQKRGDAGEAEIIRIFEPLVGLRQIRSRKRLEAGDVATGADSEIDDPCGNLHLILQRKNRKHTNVQAAWREITTADGKRADQIPVVWASWRGRQPGGRVLNLGILTFADAEQILRLAGPQWIHGVMRRLFAGAAIQVAHDFITLRADAARAGLGIPLLLLDYPRIVGTLAAMDWSTFVSAWNVARQKESHWSDDI